MPSKKPKKRHVWAHIGAGLPALDPVLSDEAKHYVADARYEKGFDHLF